MVQFKIREIFFCDTVKGILCQGPDNVCAGSPEEKGCPCALLSIWNFLVLNGDVPSKAIDHEGFKTDIEIRNYISKLCFEGIGLMQESEEDYAIDMKIIHKTLNLLSTGIKLIPDPKSPKEYFYNHALAVFIALSTYVVHGHAAEGEEASNTLTDYGMRSLLQALDEDALRILYLNGHYSVLLKKENILLTLHNQETVLTNLHDAIWKRLTVIEADSFYLTSRFSPTKQQPNMAVANKWYNENINEKFGDSGGYKREEKQKAARSLKRRICIDEGASTSSEGEKSSCPPAIDDSVNELPLLVEKEMEPSEIASEFLMFLLQFVKSGHKEPYFDGIFKSIEYHGIPNMCVPYALIERYNKRLAIAIRDQYPRIYSDLKQSFVKYLEHHKFSVPNLEHVAVLDILDLPKPKSTQSIEEFVKDHKITEEFELYGGVVKNSTAYDGRRMASGYLDHILLKFEAGHCYREPWKVSDMKVRNKTEFFIDKEAEYQLTQEDGVADLLYYCKVIFPFFRDKNGGLPVYFDEFLADCLRMPKPGTPEWKKFIKFIRSALFLKAPTVRSALLCEIFILASVKMLYGRPYIPLNNKNCLVEWRENIDSLEPFKRIYQHKNEESLYITDKWCCTYWFLLKFSRNFIQHVLNYLKKEATLHNLIVVELMLAHKLSKFISQFIWYFVNKCDVDGVFYSAWAHYEASDCTDKPRSDMSMGAREDISELIADGGINQLLHQVCTGSSIPCLEIVIKAGADVNSKINGWCPLHIAAEFGNTDIINFLLEAGGEANARNNDELTPIEVAVLKNNHEAVELLFPVTSPIPSVPNWSLDGIKKFTSSNVVKEQMKTVTVVESASVLPSELSSDERRITKKLYRKVILTLKLAIILEHSMLIQRLWYWIQLITYCGRIEACAG